jgi:uncharacterized protein
MNKPAPPKPPGGRPPAKGANAARPPSRPSSRPAAQPASKRPPHRPRPAPVEIRPLDEAELQQLQALLDGLPDTLEPLDVVMIDGYLCGVLLQPQPIAAERWLPLLTDVEGRPPPTRFDAARLRSLVLRRHAELDAAITERDWFDPWIYQLDDQASPSETVLPWVAGFATAADAFTALMDRHEDAILEPLATLYRHLDPDDLEDADALLAEIETLAPPESLDEAVEDLVRSVLQIADVSRPQEPAARPAPAPGRPQSDGPQGPRGPARKAAPRRPG